MISPLRYPGGKAKLFRYFVQLIHQNDLFERTYAEPYAGGAGLALKLLGHGFVRSIELNDIDPAIHSFWVAALDHPEEFCNLINSTPLDVEEWRRQRSIYNNGFKGDHLELGFATFFLNRTSRSGIIEGSGPIGGYAQLGNWKIDARYERKKLIGHVENLQLHRATIALSNTDALDFARSRLSAETHFTYLDPPYYVKGKKLYKNFYSHDDHVTIAELLRNNREGCWVTSYDNVPEVYSLHESFRPIIYRLHYSAGPSTGGEEIIFASDQLRLPRSAPVLKAA